MNVNETRPSAANNWAVGPTPWEYYKLANLGAWLRLLNAMTESALPPESMAELEEQVTRMWFAPQPSLEAATEQLLDISDLIEERLPGAQACLETLHRELLGVLGEEPGTGAGR